MLNDLLLLVPAASAPAGNAYEEDLSGSSSAAGAVTSAATFTEDRSASTSASGSLASARSSVEAIDSTSTAAGVVTSSRGHTEFTTGAASSTGQVSSSVTAQEHTTGTSTSIGSIAGGTAYEETIQSSTSASGDLTSSRSMVELRDGSALSTGLASSTLSAQEDLHYTSVSSGSVESALAAVVILEASSTGTGRLDAVQRTPDIVVTNEIVERAMLTAKWLIDKNGEMLQLVRFQDSPPPDPTRPWEKGPSTEITTLARGVFLRAKHVKYGLATDEQADGDDVATQERRVLMAALGLTFPPTVGCEIIAEDGRWRIVSVAPLKPGGVDIIYTIQVRR